MIATAVATIFTEGLHTDSIGRIFKEPRALDGIQYLTQSQLDVPEPMHPGIHPDCAKNRMSEIADRVPTYLSRAPARLGMTRPPDPDHEEQGNVAEQVSDPQLAPPPMYKVVLYNDDYTPMEFVVEVLQRFFGMDSEKAVQIMLAVHTQGRATCGIFTRDVAETKCHQVNEYAKECEHPLMCDVDAAE